MITENKQYKRYPAIKCWIKHVLESEFDDFERVYHSIFGKIKRVRILGTIVEKKEILTEQSSLSENLTEEYNFNADIRLEFTIDDGTGRISCIVWNPESMIREDIEEGEIIEVIGLIRPFLAKPQITPEIIRKITNPNEVLLRDAEILKKIKTEGMKEIPKLKKELSLEEDSDDINIDSLFEDDEEEEEIKEQIFKIISDQTVNGLNTSLQILTRKMDLSEKELRGYIRELETEGRIFAVDEEEYQAYI